MGGPTSWEWILYIGVSAVLEATIISVMLSFVIWFVLKKTISKLDLSSFRARDAMEIVRGRYAKGEISCREYEQIRDDLEAGDIGVEIQKEKERTR